MKDFNEYFLLQEMLLEQDAEIAFSDAENKVKEIFSYLHKIMMNTWGKKAPSWDDQLKDKVVAHLQNIIDELKGKAASSKLEHTKYLVKTSMLLEERGMPAWMKDITSKNRTITVDRMLDAMQSQVIKILHNLRDETLVKQVGNIPGEVGKVGNRVSKTVGRNIRSIGSGIQQQIAAGIKVHPDISGEMRENARYGLIQLFNAMKLNPNVKLYAASSGTRQLKYDPNDDQQMAQILDKLSKGKNFRIRIAGKDYSFDITNEADTNRILELIKSYEF